MSELTRMVDLREIGNAPVAIEATPEECAALAARFDLVAVKSLRAAISLEPKGPEVTAKGRIEANIVQSCAISGEDVPVTIDEPVALRFVPAQEHTSAGEEVELDAEQLDEIEYTGTAFDLGEAVAQSLALAIDPYLEGPGADEFRRKAGLTDQAAGNPFAALLKKDR